jgi:hypothetical protein
MTGIKDDYPDLMSAFHHRCHRRHCHGANQVCQHHHSGDQPCRYLFCHYVSPFPPDYLIKLSSMLYNIAKYKGCQQKYALFSTKAPMQETCVSYQRSVRPEQ